MDLSITLDYDIAEVLMQASVDSGLSINELINLWLDPFTDEEEGETTEEDEAAINEEIKSGWDDEDEDEDEDENVKEHRAAMERIRRLIAEDPYRPTF